MMKIIIFAFLYLLFHNGDAAFTYGLENDLRTLLFTNNSYNKLTRPDSQVTVSAKFNILTLNSLSMRDQLMKMSGYFSLEWTDARLNWTAEAAYSSDILVIYTTQDYVWIPSLSVTNSVDELAVISDDTVIIRVTNDGTLTWTPGGVYETSCSTDVTYYPFDEQECDIVLTTWGYTNVEINLVGKGVDLSYYEPDGEWEFMSFSVTSNTRTAGASSLPQITYAMKYRRRPTYQVMNTILPLILLGFLHCFVFQLPADSGEKMGYSLTTLLAFAVYLTIVSADTPTTSLHTPVLSVYLIIMLSMGVVAILLTIFVLKCHFSTEDQPIPNYIRRICSVANKMERNHCCKKSEVVDEIENDKNGNKGSPRKAFQPELSWPEVSKALDKFFFKVYTTTFLLLTFVVLFVFIIHHYT